MRIDGALSMRLESAAFEAQQFEDFGLAGAWSFEGSHDPFVPLALGSQTTSRIELGTAIAVAYARTPMTAAISGWDLQRATGGRFVLGLGTQIKPHITKRYDMPWSKPVARMREYVGAVRAIWNSFETGDRLDFQGEFYSNTLLPAPFNPGPNGDLAQPKIFLAGFGPAMVGVIGEVADGFFVHPFHSADHLTSVTLPALADGAARVDRSADDVEVACLTIVAMGADEEDLTRARRKAREQVAFYGSTPAYAGVLEHHGYDGLQGELNQMSKGGLWKEMADQIDDELFDLIVVSGSPAEVGAAVVARNTFADRTTLMFYGPQPGPEALAEAVSAAAA